MKKKESNTMLYVLIAAAVAIAAFSVYALVNTNYYGQNYQKALSAQTADKCATPEGYTDADWREHMSHHPDIYSACFK